VPQVTLAIVEGQEAGRQIPLSGTVLIGRDPSADVVVEDAEVSTRHASFAPSEGGAVVEDLGSTNGTFVNGSRVESVQALALGDTIEVGTAGLLVKSLPTPPTPPGQETSVRGVAPVALPVLDLRLRVDFEAREVHLSSDGEPAVRLAFDSGRWRIEAEG